MEYSPPSLEENDNDGEELLRVPLFPPSEDDIKEASNINNNTDDHQVVSDVIQSDHGSDTDGMSNRRKRRMCCPSSPPDDSSNSSSCTSRNSNIVETTKRFVSGTLLVMNFLAKVLLYTSGIATIAGVVWYSIELKNNGTDPHLIAWFSAGAFVILGFPISIYGIFQHLSNYYQPSIQCYVVRILWMVPIYSIESWLSLRFHEFAIYIETARDVYESYVLYSFTQYLIEVMGGEQELVLLLKDKSPTRGVHIYPMNWCIKPWLMGQPVTRTTTIVNDDKSSNPANNSTSHLNQSKRRRIKQVHWTSPFYIKCKLGVLQYVLFKIFTAVLTMILEFYDLYEEGDFSPNKGYLYISFITNTSQCWALYCLVFFYNATKNELAPISPVGKFLSVKCVVFFTWWQSLFIGILAQMQLIPAYNDWSEQEVAKGLQAYLICIEMFAAAIVHTFVFPHTDYIGGKMNMRLSRNSTTGNRGKYLPLHHSSAKGKFDSGKHDNYGISGHAMIGRKNHFHRRRMKEDVASRAQYKDVEHASLIEMAESSNLGTWDEESSVASSNISDQNMIQNHSQDYPNKISEEPERKTNFVKAFLDSTLPKDVMDNTVGIVKGEFHVERKTLLHHATTSDHYDLFSSANSSHQRRKKHARKHQDPTPSKNTATSSTVSNKADSNSYDKITRKSSSPLKENRKTSKMSMNDFLQH